MLYSPYTSTTDLLSNQSQTIVHLRTHNYYVVHRSRCQQTRLSWTEVSLLSCYLYITVPPAGSKQASRLVLVYKLRSKHKEQQGYIAAVCKILSELVAIRFVRWYMTNGSSLQSTLFNRVSSS